MMYNQVIQHWKKVIAVNTYFYRQDESFNELSLRQQAPYRFVIGRLKFQKYDYQALMYHDIDIEEVPDEIIRLSIEK